MTSVISQTIPTTTAGTGLIVDRGATTAPPTNSRIMKTSARISLTIEMLSMGQTRASGRSLVRLSMRSKGRLRDSTSS